MIAEMLLRLSARTSTAYCRCAWSTQQCKPWRTLFSVALTCLDPRSSHTMGQSIVQSISILTISHYSNQQMSLNQPGSHTPDWSSKQRNQRSVQQRVTWSMNWSKDVWRNYYFSKRITHFQFDRYQVNDLCLTCLPACDMCRNWITWPPSPWMRARSLPYSPSHLPR